jgi:K+-transporting ATPase A subunit
MTGQSVGQILFFVGALVILPALTLGPIVEGLAH